MIPSSIDLTTPSSMMKKIKDSTDTIHQTPGRALPLGPTVGNVIAAATAHVKKASMEEKRIIPNETKAPAKVITFKADEFPPLLSKFLEDMRGAL